MSSIQPQTPSRASTFVEWLHTRPDWQFTGLLYVLRWVIILPLALVLSPLAASADVFEAERDPLVYLIPFLVVAPLLETLIECTLPYTVMYRLMKMSRRSPWPFVFVSATLMVLLHPITPLVVLMAFITGAFLAYVYFHFAHRSQLRAFLHTMVFHAAINFVGWTMILLGAWE